MSSKIFIVYSGLLIFTNILFSRISPQMSDFLCGCEYCETVDRHSPLNIGYHFSRCHSWRDSWAKSRQAMIDSQKPDVGIPIKDTLPDHSRKIFGENSNDDNSNSNNIHKKDTTLKEPNMNTIDDPYNDYQWRYIETQGWTYSTTHQSTTTTDGWLYREDLGWVWTFTESRNFLYSEQYGWFYTMRYNDRNLLYYYDRKYWLYAYDFWWKK